MFQCELQPDTGEYLLWHYGRGKMISYSYLLKCMISFVNGSSLNSLFDSRSEYLASVQSEKSTLSIKILSKSFTGKKHNSLINNLN